VASIPVQETRYVRAVELRPGNPRVVHHARMMVWNSRATPVTRKVSSLGGRRARSRRRDRRTWRGAWSPAPIWSYRCT
jgi:hypothetical protein